MALSNGPQTPGSLLEQALVWGVPVAPVFVLMMMVVIYTPSSLPMYASASFYLICMAGASLGFLACALVRTWTPVLRQVACWGSAVVLEVAFACLCQGFFAPERFHSAYTVIGSLLSGLGTAVMLVLWLSFRQTGDLRCEIAKLGVALIAAFVVHGLLGVLEGGDWMFSVFPLLTCIPFSVMSRGRASGATAQRTGAACGVCEVGARGEKGEGLADRLSPGGVEGQDMRPYESVPGDRLAGVGKGDAAVGVRGACGSMPGKGRSACSCDGAEGPGGVTRLRRAVRATWVVRPMEMVVISLAIAVFGAGFAALGFGGSPSEYGTGLAGVILLLFAMTPRIRRPLSLTGHIAFLLATVALCCSVLLGGMSPFSTHLAGCIALATWALLATRLKDGAVTAAGPGEMALELLWINTCAAGGLALARALFTATGASPQLGAIVLVCTLACVGFLWEVAVLPRVQGRSVVPAGAPVAFGVSEEALSRAFGLSPREAQVACLLLESRSVTYICEALGLAMGTAKTHIQHVYEKADVHSKSEFQLRVDTLMRNREGL